MNNEGTSWRVFLETRQEQVLETAYDLACKLVDGGRNVKEQKILLPYNEETLARATKEFAKVLESQTDRRICFPTGHCYLKNSCARKQCNACFFINKFKEGK